MKIGDKVYVRENTRVELGLPDGVKYTIKDTLNENVPFPVVLSAEELGEDWREFFRYDELIPIEDENN